MFNISPIEENERRIGNYLSIWRWQHSQRLKTIDFDNLWAILCRNLFKISSKIKCPKSKTMLSKENNINNKGQTEKT